MEQLTSQEATNLFDEQGLGKGSPESGTHPSVAVLEAIARRFHERELEEPLECLAKLIHPDAEMALVLNDFRPVRGRDQIMEVIAQARHRMIYSAEIEACEVLAPATLLLRGQAPIRSRRRSRPLDRLLARRLSRSAPLAGRGLPQGSRSESSLRDRLAPTSPRGVATRKCVKDTLGAPKCPSRAQTLFDCPDSYVLAAREMALRATPGQLSTTPANPLRTSWRFKSSNPHSRFGPVLCLGHPSGHQGLLRSPFRVVCPGGPLTGASEGDLKRAIERGNVVIAEAALGG
jgi:hypothetical protein